VKGPKHKLAIENARLKKPELYAQIRRGTDQRRREREKNAEGSFSKRDIAALRKMQNGKCWWCQCELTEYQVDHRIPLAKLGTNKPNNLVLSCPDCNRRKAAKMPWETDNPRLL
jgi:5-methylcytosine-specific restriction endonuclease McrA